MLKSVPGGMQTNSRTPAFGGVSAVEGGRGEGVADIGQLRIQEYNCLTGAVANDILNSISRLQHSHCVCTHLLEDG